MIHANHPAEISREVPERLTALGKTGITLLNQSVLLRGVNDDANILAELSERLFAATVLPYYLHMLDKVAGAAHFDLPESRALELWQDLHARLPGYLLPTLVREEPGKAGKTPYPLQRMNRKDASRKQRINLGRAQFPARTCSFPVAE